MPRSLLIGLCLLTLTGCVNPAERRAEREAILGAYVGQSESDLVRELGVPARVFEAGGHRFLAYIERRTEVLPGYAPFAPYRSGFGYGAGFPPEIIQRACETTFEVVSGKVSAYAVRGSACL